MKNILIILSVIFFAHNSHAQEPANDLFNLKYTSLNNAMTGDNKNIVNEANIEMLREQYKLLDVGLKEISMFNYKVLDKGTVFNKKELKKLQKKDQINVLETIINKKSVELKYMLGQSDQYGIGKDDCLKTYSNFKNCISRDDIETAEEYWNELYTYYPRFQNFYSFADVLLSKKIDASSGKEKEKYIDSLLAVYDQRIKYFSNDKNYGKDYLTGRKGGYMYQYRKEKQLSEAYTLLKESVENQKENSKYSVVRDFFDATLSMIKAKKISSEEFVSNYTTASSIVKLNTILVTGYIENENKKEDSDEDLIDNWRKEIINNSIVSDYITKAFASAEESKCEFLIPEFKKHFTEHQQDQEWLKLVSGILWFKECTSDPFYGEVSKVLYKLDPTANAAFKLAIFYLTKKNYKEAAKYIKEAYTLETDNEKKSEYYYYAAVIAFAQNQYSNSKTLALNSSKLNKKYGKPFVLIAKLYAGSTGTCGKDKFEKSAVYWLAADMLIKAKSVDKSVAAEADDLLGKYLQRYPNNEELFMRGLYEGDTYKIGCWINETTTVKLKK